MYVEVMRIPRTARRSRGLREDQAQLSEETLWRELPWKIVFLTLTVALIS